MDLIVKWSRSAGFDQGILIRDFDRASLRSARGLISEVDLISQVDLPVG